MMLVWLGRGNKVIGFIWPWNSLSVSYPKKNYTERRSVITRWVEDTMMHLMITPKCAKDERDDGKSCKVVQFMKTCQTFLSNLTLPFNCLCDHLTFNLTDVTFSITHNTHCKTCVTINKSAIFLWITNSKELLEIRVITLKWSSNRI